MQARQWLVSAVALFIGATALLVWGDRADKRRAEASIVFPVQMRPKEVERARKRSGRMHLPRPQDPTQRPDPSNPDPFLAALPSGASAHGLVFEKPALHDPILGPLFVDCLKGELDPSVVELLKNHQDVFSQADRFGFSDEGLLVSGLASGALDPLHPTPVGPAMARAKLYRMDAPLTYAGTWKDEITLFAAREDTVTGVMNRLGADAASLRPLLTDFQTYGDIYGTVTPATLRKFVAGLGSDWVELFEKSVRSIDLHADAGETLAIVAELTCFDGELAHKLAKRLGEAFTQTELLAEKNGDDGLADMLEQSRVFLTTNKVKVQVAFPAPLVARSWAGCASE